MKIQSSKLKLFDKRAKRDIEDTNRELRRLVGKNLWVKVELFKNSPLSMMHDMSASFGLNGICWVRLLGESNDSYIFNLVKCPDSNNNEISDSSIEVTKEQIKKILTSKCKLHKSSFTLVHPVDCLSTGELFTVSAAPIIVDDYDDEDEDEDIEYVDEDY